MRKASWIKHTGIRFQTLFPPFFNQQNANQQHVSQEKRVNQRSKDWISTNVTKLGLQPAEMGIIFAKDYGERRGYWMI